MTKTQRAAWLQKRQKGIGGSDVSAILGLNRYKTPMDIFISKTEPIVEEEQSESAYFGTLLEDLIAQEFSRRMSLNVQRINTQLEHPEAPWRLANIDRAIVNPEIAMRVSVVKEDKRVAGSPIITTDAILECKTASAYTSDLWGQTQEYQLLNGEEEASEHKIPLAYECQIQWYMGVTGVKLAYVAVLIGGQDFRIYRIKRDDELINALFARCDEFWEEKVLKGIAPDPINREDALRAFPQDSGEMLEADEQDAVWIGELRTIAGQIKNLTDQEIALKQKLILKVKDASGMTLGGDWAFTYRAQLSTRFSSAEFKKEYPDLYSEYAKTTETRVFRLR